MYGVRECFTNHREDGIIHEVVLGDGTIAKEVKHETFSFKRKSESLMTMRDVLCNLGGGRPNINFSHKGYGI